MTGVKIAGRILSEIQKEIRTPDFKERYFPMESRAFSRKRKMPFCDMISFLMKRSTTSYAIKLSDWIVEHQRTELSKQAVSKARQNLPVKIFQDIFEYSAELFQKETRDMKHWKGYQILAIDGTTLQIPTTEETLTHFGEVGTKFEKPMAGASSSAIYDVRSGVLLSCVIKPYRTAERDMAKELIEKVIPIIEKENTILVFDRGYPGYEFLEYLTDCGIQYVIRIKKQMTKLRTPGRKDGEVYRKCGKKCRTIRTIEIPLPGGKEENEYLITNVTKERVEWSSFKELYQMRWGIEGKFRELKSQLELESFSGKKPICIEQDYYITMFLSNIVSMLKNTVDEEVKEEYQGKKEYQGNRGYIIHELNRIISGILMKKHKIDGELEEIIKKSKKIRSQVRRNRTYERNANLNRRKYSMTYKSYI